MSETKRLATASIQSLLFHLFFVFLFAIAGYLPKLPNFQELRRRQQLAEQSFEVDRISQEQLRRYRTVGVRGGSKNFNLQVPNGNQAKKNQGKAPPPPPKGDPKGSAKGSEKGTLSLSELRARVKQEDLEKIKSQKEIEKEKLAEDPAHKKLDKQTQTSLLLKKEIQAAEAGIPLTSLRSNQAVQNFRRQRNLQEDMLRQLGTESTRSEVLKRTGFNLHFEPPEGISEDELNTVEKIFYSFQKRTFISYVNAFVATYQDKLLNAPQIRRALQSERHLLTGKIDFDKEGNILRIKILRSSHNDEVHDLFEKTLREIRTLPNPPKALIEKKDQFTIYYQLRINN